MTPPLPALASVPAPLTLAPQPEPAEDDYGVQFRRVHGYRRAFVKVGRGPVLLLIHGIGDSSDTWRPILPLLARDYTVIAPDLLGHGRSDKPRADYSVAAYANGMRDLLTVLDVERATVVGHSFGGGVALQFAYQYPERCERLVLVSPGGIGNEVHPLLRLASALPAQLVLPALRWPFIRACGHVLLRALSLVGTDLGCDADDMLRVFDALPDSTARLAFIRTLRSVVDWRGQAVTMLDRAYLMRNLPTLLMWGTRDAVVPFSHAKEAHTALPGSQLAIFHGSGHFPHHSDRDGFVAVLRQFLTTHAAAPPDAEGWQALLRRGRPDVEQVASGS